MDQEVMASAEHSQTVFPFSASKSGSARLGHDLRNDQVALVTPKSQDFASRLVLLRNH
jgi:hypothetical protein